MSLSIYASTINLSNGSSFIIYSNLGSQITEALQAWTNKTNDFTAQSFCDFINTKRLATNINTIAFTEERWKEMQEKVKNQ